LEIAAAAKSVFDETKDVIITWFGVLSKGPSAFANVDLGTNSALLFALRFLFYVSVVDFAVSIPAAAANGVRYEDKMFFAVSVTTIYVEYLSVALILYGAMKLFGGKAPLQACIAGYCFLTAYLPVAAILRMPLMTVLNTALTGGVNYPDQIKRGFALLLGLSRWDKTVFILAAILSTAAYVFFLVNVFRCFRKLHGLRTGRAGAAFAVGLLLAQLFAMAFLMPFDGAISRAFAGH